LAAHGSRLSPLRELQLVEAYRKGGQAAHDALRELVDSYQRRIYSVCYRMVRHRDDASDLTQDVLIKLIESLDSYNGQSKLSTWVIRVTMNACLSHLRRQKVRHTQSLDALSRSPTESGPRSGGIRNISASRELSASSHPDPPGRGGNLGGQAEELLPHQRVEQAQRMAVVEAALLDLDPDTRAILVLRDVQDLDYQHLAEVLEIPLGTVKSRLFRAREALRTAIEARTGGEKL
jgi:RNA polymerase sigma-70 factor (ECF subfamily)